MSKESTPPDPAITSPSMQTSNRSISTRCARIKTVSSGVVWVPRLAAYSDAPLEKFFVADLSDMHDQNVSNAFNANSLVG